MMEVIFSIAVVTLLILIMMGMSVIYERLDSIQKELREIRLRIPDDKGDMIGAFHRSPP